MVNDVGTDHYLVAYRHLIYVHCSGTMTILSWDIIVIAILSSGFIITITVSAIPAASSVATIAVLLWNRAMLRNRTIIISKIVIIMDIINRNVLAVIRTVIRDIITITMGVIALLPNC